jgi:hypothetical protein
MGNWTLAGSPTWVEMQRSKNIMQYSQHEREFINEALTSNWSPEIKGTSVHYVDDPTLETLSNFSKDQNDSSAGSAHQTGHRKRLMNMGNLAKRLYPGTIVRGTVGGAKALGGAIRHPMITNRKVNEFMKRKHAEKHARRNGDFDNLPPLKRSATMTDIPRSNTMTSTSEGISLKN